MQNNTETAQAVRRPKRHPYAARLGGAYILLAVIGLVAIVLFSINMTKKLFDNSGQIDEFERMLMPVLMFDPVPFDSIEDADPVMLLQSSLWSTLYSDKRESYVYDDSGMMIVPASDVDIAAARLFGSAVRLRHRTFGDFESSYYYDSSDKIYRIPLLAQVGYYIPSVESVKKVGDLYELRVGYVAPGNQWMTDATGKRYDATPDKYMNYYLKKERGEYYIVSISDTGDATNETHR